MVYDLYEIECIQKFRLQLTGIYNTNVEMLEAELIQLTDFLVLKGTVLKDNPYLMIYIREQIKYESC